MNHSLQEKILKMDMEQLNKIIENPELYSPEAVELVKSRVEELKKLAEMSKELQAKVEAMSIDELKQVISEPELYSKDVVQFAKHCLKDKKKDFSDVPQEAKDSLSKMTAEQLLDMLDEKEDMLSENIVLYIKDIISNKLNEPTGDESSVNIDKEKTVSDTSIVKNATITVEEGHYRVWKKFFSLIYRTVKTDLSFQNDRIVINKGTGFSKAKKFVQTEIMYEDITSVKVRRKVDTTNLILAAFGIIGALITQVWAALFVVAVVLYWGLTAVATINYKNDMCEYDIPTEFKSDALDAKGKIDLALSQFGKKTTDTTIL